MFTVSWGACPTTLDIKIIYTRASGYMCSSFCVRIFIRLGKCDYINEHSKKILISTAISLSHLYTLKQQEYPEYMEHKVNKVFEKQNCLGPALFWMIQWFFIQPSCLINVSFQVSPVALTLQLYSVTTPEHCSGIFILYEPESKWLSQNHPLFQKPCFMH